MDPVPRPRTTEPFPTTPAHARRTSYDDMDDLDEDASSPSPLGFDSVPVSPFLRPVPAPRTLSDNPLPERQKQQQMYRPPHQRRGEVSLSSFPLTRAPGHLPPPPTPNAPRHHRPPALKLTPSSHGISDYSPHLRGPATAPVPRITPMPRTRDATTPTRLRSDNRLSANLADPTTPTTPGFSRKRGITMAVLVQDEMIAESAPITPCVLPGPRSAAPALNSQSPSHSQPQPLAIFTPTPLGSARPIRKRDDACGTAPSPVPGAAMAAPPMPKELILCRYYHMPMQRCTSSPCRFVHDLPALSRASGLSGLRMSSPGGNSPSVSVRIGPLSRTASIAIGHLAPPSATGSIAAGGEDPTRGTFAAAQDAAPVPAALELSEVDLQRLTSGEAISVRDERGAEMVGQVFKMSGGGKGPAGKSRLKFRTVPCRDFASGKCAYGDYCSFIHDPNNLYDPEKHAKKDDKVTEHGKPAEEATKGQNTATMALPRIATEDGAADTVATPTPQLRSVLKKSLSINNLSFSASASESSDGLERAHHLLPGLLAPSFFPEIERPKSTPAIIPQTPAISCVPWADMAEETENTTSTTQPTALRFSLAPPAVPNMTALSLSPRSVQTALHHGVPTAAGPFLPSPKLSHRSGVAALSSLPSAPAIGDCLAPPSPGSSVVWSSSTKGQSATDWPSSHTVPPPPPPTATSPKSTLRLAAGGKGAKGKGPTTATGTANGRRHAPPQAKGKARAASSPVNGTAKTIVIEWPDLIAKSEVATLKAAAAVPKTASAISAWTRTPTFATSSAQTSFSQQKAVAHSVASTTTSSDEELPPGFIAQGDTVWTPRGYVIRNRPSVSHGTKLCKYFAMGACASGDKCGFLHPAPGESVALPSVSVPHDRLAHTDAQTAAQTQKKQQPQWKNIICTSYNAPHGCAHSEDKCQFTHLTIIPEGPRVIRRMRSRVCRHYVAGKCHMGDMCFFLHPPAGSTATGSVAASPLTSYLPSGNMTPSAGANWITLAPGVVDTPTELDTDTLVNSVNVGEVEEGSRNEDSYPLESSGRAEPSAPIPVPIHGAAPCAPSQPQPQQFPGFTFPFRRAPQGAYMRRSGGATQYIPGAPWSRGRNHGSGPTAVPTSFPRVPHNTPHPHGNGTPAGYRHVSAFGTFGSTAAAVGGPAAGEVGAVTAGSARSSFSSIDSSSDSDRSYVHVGVPVQGGGNGHDAAVQRNTPTEASLLTPGVNGSDSFFASASASSSAATSISPPRRAGSISLSLSGSYPFSHPHSHSYSLASSPAESAAAANGVHATGAEHCPDWARMGYCAKGDWCAQSHVGEDRGLTEEALAAACDRLRSAQQNGTGPGTGDDGEEDDDDDDDELEMEIEITTSAPTTSRTHSAHESHSSRWSTRSGSEEAEVLPPPGARGLAGLGLGITLGA